MYSLGDISENAIPNSPLPNRTDMGPVLQVSASTENVASCASSAPASPESLLAPSTNLQDPAVIDRWSELEAELAPLAPKFKEKEELRTRILSWLPENLPGNKGVSFDGAESSVLISVCDLKREVTSAGKKALRRLWGLALFREKSTVNLKQLPDPKDPLGLYTEQSRSGPRHLKSIKLLKPAA
jgi:hypothetical protein